MVFRVIENFSTSSEAITLQDFGSAIAGFAGVFFGESKIVIETNWTFRIPDVGFHDWMYERVPHKNDTHFRTCVTRELSICSHLLHIISSG